VQWFGQLADAFGAERVGAFYGDEKEVRPITVTTYHSAFRLLEREGARFDLLVLDEVHHLADAAGGEARSWHDALTVAPATRRLGLTATYPDGADGALLRLVGPVAFRRRIGEMTDRELADFVVERHFVPLTPDEESRYRACDALYEEFRADRAYEDRAPTPKGSGSSSWQRRAGPRQPAGRSGPSRSGNGSWRCRPGSWRWPPASFDPIPPRRRSSSAAPGNPPRPCPDASPFR